VPKRRIQELKKYLALDYVKSGTDFSLGET
jgi:hypothetical protein